MTGARPVFPLVPRRRVRAARIGGMRSARRGGARDPASSRPYRAGDDVRRIDRYASVRLSAAAGRDELVVREHHAEEAARVVVAVDDAPTMRLFPDTLPWLRKPDAVASASGMIAESARDARSRVELLPASGRLEEALAGLVERPRVPAGTFVFVLSDFLAFPPDRLWSRALSRGWELVPVVIQDPVWEQSFPAVGGTVLPIADAETGRVRLARLRPAEAEARRAENEARLAAILARFAALDVAPVLLSAHDADAIHDAFLSWADARRPRGRWWRR